MPILDINNADKIAEYEDFVSKSPYGNHMQSLNWAKVKNNWDSDYVYLEDPKGKIRAALSILSVKNDGVHSFLYAPRGPVCDINDLETFNLLLKEAEPIMQKRNAFLLRIDPEVPYDDNLIRALKSGLQAQDFEIRTRGTDEHSFSNPRQGMVLSFEGRNFEQIWKDFTSKRRSQFRKPYKSGLETRRIKRNDPDFDRALNTFYDLLELTGKRQGITYRPKAYFDRLFQAFPDVTLYETYDSEEVLASAIVLTYNRKAFYIYSASSSHKRKLNASSQMNVEAIKDASKKEGVQEYDMGGIFSTDSRDGLYSFKENFCGEKGLRELVGEIDIILDRQLYKDFIGR